MSAEIADVLDRAADRIERDGWWQRGYYEGAQVYRYEAVAAHLRKYPEPCCLRGAIIAEAHPRIPDRATYSIAELLGCDFNDVAEWNDAPERTQAEVVAALRGAAEQERGAS